ncbi:hypothetical protein GGU11DRAFT_431944 [Lentinula aff. detonsa]|nr:hypothetical protein GGU11DRAFT_431944 [Lentinula aff. detonsa]
MKASLDLIVLCIMLFMSSGHRPGIVSCCIRIFAVISCLNVEKMVTTLRSAVLPRTTYVLASEFTELRWIARYIDCIDVVSSRRILAYPRGLKRFKIDILSTPLDFCCSQESSPRLTM